VSTAKHLSVGQIAGWSIYAVLSIVLILLAFSFDTEVREAIVADQAEIAAADGKKKFHHTDTHNFWAKVSKYGDWPQLMLAGAALGAVAVWRKRSDWTRVLVAALIASTLAGVLANASRLTTGKVRPRHEAEHGAGFHGPWHNGKLTIGNSGFNAFPSGHTATAVGFATPFLFAKPIVGIPVFCAALAIAWSRMQLGAHHLSDVVTATLLALAVGIVVLRWIQSRGDTAWAWIVTKVQLSRRGGMRSQGYK
jgi:membrane-associated phospholipid phosphatase